MELMANFFSTDEIRSVTSFGFQQRIVCLSSEGFQCCMYVEKHLKHCHKLFSCVGLACSYDILGYIGCQS